MCGAVRRAAVRAHILHHTPQHHSIFCRRNVPQAHTVRSLDATVTRVMMDHPQVATSNHTHSGLSPQPHARSDLCLPPVPSLCAATLHLSTIAGGYYIFKH
mmetsp:Transcript_4347/g.9415  ORF Transcript_4347/g.9415 Transcript_4347/m.9415 type:complete len:101 (+) Transcript_4347:1294-1596(+)